LDNFAAKRKTDVKRVAMEVQQCILFYISELRYQQYKTVKPT
jgi:hypothetical protein